MLETAKVILYVSAMCILALFILLVLIRAILGPRVTDRILCSNMIGTLVIMILAILSLWIGEGYLIDICIIYAMISFVAVVVMYRVYTNRHRVVDIEKLEVVGAEEIGTEEVKAEDIEEITVVDGRKEES